MEKTSVEGHYIFYCEGLHNGKSFGMGKLMGEVPQRTHVLSLVSVSGSHEKGMRHAWYWCWTQPGRGPGNV